MIPKESVAFRLTRPQSANIEKGECHASSQPLVDLAETHDPGQINRFPLVRAASRDPSDFPPAQTSDTHSYGLVVVDNLDGATDLLADRAYGSVHIRKAIQHRGALPVMPMQMSRKMRIGVYHSL